RTDRVETLAGSIEHEGITVDLAGGYAIATVTSRGIRRDLSRSILVAVILVHALFFVLYRHPLAPFVVGASAALGILAGFGVQSVGHAVITPLSASIGAMLAGLGVDYGVHLLSHYQTERPDAPDTVEATRRSVRLVGGAILASGLTTAIGFGSMIFSGVTMLRGFAIIGVACLLGCLASVLLLMPASFRMVDRARTPRTPRLSWVGDAITRRWRACLLAGLVLLAAQSVAIGVMGWLPPVETDLSTMHPRPNRALEVTESLPSRFEGEGEWLPVEVRGTDARSMLDAAHRIDNALTGEAGREIGVVRTFGVHTLIPDPDRSGRRLDRLRAIDPDRVREDFENAIADSVFADDAFVEYADTVAELVRARPPSVEELRRFPAISSRMLPDPDVPDRGAGLLPQPAEVLPDDPTPTTNLETRSLLVVQMGVSLADRDTRDAAVEGIRRLLEPIPGATLSGVTAVAFDLERATRGELRRLALTAGGLIVGCLLVILRRPTLVLLALIPMATGGLAMLAAMMLTDLRLNALNSAAVPLLLGITVDAGVILVAFWAGHRPGRPIRFGSCVQAVLAASLTTLVGFGAVCLSSTPAIRSLALLTCFGVLGSTLGTLLVLVPVLSRLTHAPDGAGHGATTDHTGGPGRA
ncbi:MAG: MMPL family transporter, partial [Phycisphaerales bacterium JB040]